MGSPDGGQLVSVVGGGAIGGLLAALLARAGRSVELIVREGQAPAYRTGIRVATPSGAFRQAVMIASAPAAGTALVVIAVKLPDLDAACRLAADPTARRLGGARDDQANLPPVLLIQNGLDALDLAARRLPPSRLYAASVELGATTLAPGEVTYSIPGRLVIGAAVADNTAGAERVAALLSPALPCVVTADIRGAQRLKFLVNLNNGVGAATGLTIQQLYGSADGVRLSLGVMREGLKVLQAAGQAPPNSRRSRLLRLALQLPDPLAIAAFRLTRRAMGQRAPVYSSTLQSVMRRRPSEISWLNGYVVRLSEGHGVGAPLNRAVVRVVSALEAGERADFVTPAALLATRQETSNESLARPAGAA